MTQGKEFSQPAVTRTAAGAIILLLAESLHTDIAEVAVLLGNAPETILADFQQEAAS